VFLCSMLNAQPMGFYMPSTLIEDAARHGVLTLPIDVNHSQWDCTLERTEVPVSPRGAPLAGAPQQRAFREQLAVRMGYCYVQGFGVLEQKKLMVLPRPLRTIEDFVKKSQLPLRALVALCEAGAFDSLGITRREALWRARSACRGTYDALYAEPDSLVPPLAALSLREQVLWDYRVAEHSTRGHPMAPLRAWLTERGIVGAEEVRELPHGKRVDCVGLVICRQRPGTATGVVFLTLEDELGFVNVVVWNNVYERYQRVLRTASLLGVRGTLQSVEGVVHLIAEELYVPKLTLGEHVHHSRDFH
jgi:error-prone DNA polymerase